mgnify:CR=1 FL=1
MENKYKSIIRTRFYFICSMFLALGIIVGINWQNTWFPFVLCFIIFIGLLLRQSDKIFLFLLSSLIFTSGWFISSVRNNEIEQNLSLADSLHGKTVSFSGIVHSIKETEYGWRTDCEILFLSDNPIKGDFNVSVYGKGPIPNEGDTLLSKGEMKKLVGKRNPGDFDFRSHFSRQGNYGRLFIDKKYDSCGLMIEEGSGEESDEDYQNRVPHINGLDNRNRGMRIKSVFLMILATINL